MNTIEDLHTLVRLLTEFELPVSPILEYAIKNKEEELIASEQYIQQRDSSTDNVESSKDLTKNFDNKLLYYDNNKTTQPESLINFSKDRHKIKYIEGPGLYRKLVDKSVLKQGFVIRKHKHEDFFNALGHQMQPGSNEYVCFMVGNEHYEVKLSYIQRQTGGTQLFAFYGNDLQERFQREFPNSFRSLMEKRQNMEIKHGIFATVDEGEEEYIDLYKTSNPQIFQIKCIKYNK